MVLGGGLVLAISAIALWRFSLPNWGTGLAMLGGVLGFSAMASPLVPEQQGDPGSGGTDGGGDAPDGQAPEAAGDSGGGDGGGGQ